VPNSSDLGRGYTPLTVDGQRPLSNSVIINGVDANSIGTGSTPNLAVPATDTLQEFIVQTSLYDASQGRNAGSVVAVVTKSGTNQFHGNLYEFLRNTSLDANDFFLNAAGVPRPPYRRNQFGGTLGGPIWRNRVWFFVSYQGTRETNGTSLVNSIGTAFVPSDLTNDRSTATLQAFAASYGVPPCSNMPSTGCLDPTALFLLQAKLPNGQYVIPSAPHPVPIPASGVAPLVPVPVVGISTFREDQFNTNLDFKLSNANHLAAKFFFANNPELQALFNSFGLGNALPVPGFGAQTGFNQRVLSLDDTHVIAPTLLNDARFGYSVITTFATPQEPFTSAQLGISSPLSTQFPGMPEISVANDFDLGASPFSDNSAKEATYTATDMLTWTHGRHSLKFGVEFHHDNLLEYFNLYTRGDIYFLGFSTDPVTGLPDPFKDFLGGFFDLTGLTIMGSGVNNRNILATDWSGYVNDDFKVTARLTLNLGLRYDFFGPFTEAHGEFVGIDPSKITTVALPNNGGVAITGGFVQASNATTPLPGVPLVSPSLVNPDYKDVAPRLGFAWQPFSASGRFVVRGGYGIYYDRPNSRIVNNELLDFPYYVLAQAFTTPIADPFVQVPPPSAFPLTFNNSAIFPFGGPPAFLPAAVSGGVAAVPANGLYPDIHDFRTPYVQQYSLGTQTEFGNSWMLDVSYVGTGGRDLLQLLDLNQAIGPITLAPGPYSPGLSALAVQGFGVHVMQSSGISNYNSLQTSLTKHFSKGLQFLAAYTYSHALDTYSGDPTGTSDVTVVPGNEAILHNYASSDFDRRHRFVFSGIYDLPKLYRGELGAAKQVANGWELATIITIQSGTPFSVLTNDTEFIQARADYVAGCNPVIGGSTSSKLTNYFNTACFTPATSVGDFGDTGRNILVGPGQKDVDLSLIKHFPISERASVEFRGEFFNAFNNVNFANPVNVLASTNVGQIVATTTGPRVIQFALKFGF
jgi:TonB dependent receptor